MNILETIVEQKKREVALLPNLPAALENLLWTVKAFGPRRDFADELRFPRSGRMALIAEVKKASPSAGVICPDFDPVRIARAYEAAGASCLSVLTDEQFFQGSLNYLRAIREAVQIPLLRKDFIIHERQILQSIEWGADAILLIVAILTDDQLKRFHALAEQAGLAVLVEAHDEIELDRALAAGAKLIGVNNRALKTFTVDLQTTVRLGAKLRASANGSGESPLLVSESGIRSAADVEILAAAGANAILVGETLMREGDMAAKASELMLR